MLHDYNQTTSTCQLVGGVNGRSEQETCAMFVHWPEP